MTDLWVNKPTFGKGNYRDVQAIGSRVIHSGQYKIDKMTKTNWTLIVQVIAVSVLCMTIACLVILLNSYKTQIQDIKQIRTRKF